MIKINWRVRMMNPIFWSQIVLGIMNPIFLYCGVNWCEITTWSKLFAVLIQAVENPIVVVAIVISIANVINDPTTRGLSDSDRALGYDVPK